MPHYFIHQKIEHGGTPAEEKRLVEAKNAAAAIAHVVRSSIACRLASTQDVIDCTKAGIEVEKA